MHKSAHKSSTFYAQNFVNNLCYCYVLFHILLNNYKKAQLMLAYPLDAKR